MKIAISTESMADLSAEVIEQYNLHVAQFSVLLGDKTYKDCDITVDDIIDFVNKNNVLPKTSAINEEQYTEHFENLLKEYDGVVHFAVSSKLSSSYEHSVAAAAKFKNVYTIDTRTLSTGMALLAIYGSKLAKTDKTAEEIYNLCLQRVPYVEVSFALKRLDYLYKGGRCSALAYFGANLLKIRPLIVLKDGQMVPGDKKYRGSYEHVMKKYCEDVLVNCENPDLSEAFVTYSAASDEVVQTAYDALKERGFKNIHVTRTGATITSHCGEECLGLLFINDGEHNV